MPFILIEVYLSHETASSIKILHVDIFLADCTSLRRKRKFSHTDCYEDFEFHNKQWF